jgi:hypothetical protein
VLDLTTETELIALHSGVVKESLHLEYKASDAIDKRDDRKKLEIARDVSAFANADGGQIVYGMTENKDHEPDGLDAGLDPHEYPEIWFDQVLQSNVTPLLSAVKPRHVPLSNGRVAVVLDIPASQGDPHQVDGRYYRRHNFNRLQMEHYEVRDIFRRSVNPDLSIEFFFDKMEKTQHFQFPMGEADHVPVPVSPILSNRSNAPAEYAVAIVFADARLIVLNARYRQQEPIKKGNVKVVPYQLVFDRNKTMPLFKEQPTLMPNLGIIVPAHLRSRHRDYYLGYEVRAPGCHVEGSVRLFVENGQRILLSN